MAGGRDRAMLKQMQELPLDMKIKMTESRIREWYDHWMGKVYVSFSGGKDSTVLLDIARRLYPDIEAVFVDTGLEFPEIKQFVKRQNHTTVIRPSMTFSDVLSVYGYPILSKSICHSVRVARNNPDGKVSTNLFEQSTGIFGMKRWRELLKTNFVLSEKCCDVMKKKPLHDYQKSTGKMPLTAEMACESRMREQNWIETGCNAFDAKVPKSKPMSFWTEQDVLLYIKLNNLPIASVYGEVVYDVEDPEQERFDGFVTHKLKTTGCKRTGCVFCGYGAHLEKESRFVALSHTHTHDCTITASTVESSERTASGDQTRKVSAWDMYSTGSMNCIAKTANRL